MNKKIMSLVLATIFLIGIVTAGIVSNLSPHNPIIDVDKKTNDELIEEGLTNIKHSECNQIKGNDDYCEFKMYDGNYGLGTHRILSRYCADNNTYIEAREVGEINQPTHTEYFVIENKSAIEGCKVWVDYTQPELEGFMDVKIKEWLNKFTDNSIAEKNSNQGDEKVGSGDIIIRERK